MKYFGRFSANGRLLMASILVLSAVLLSAVGSSAQRATKQRSLSIIAEPNAKVWIKGVFRGTTAADGRLEVRSAPAGSLPIRVRADGFKDAERTVTAAFAGEINFKLIETSDPAELAFQEAERQKDVDRELAAESYKKAVGLRPNYPEAWVGLARVRAGMGKFAEAERAIAAARQHRPGFAEASAVEGRIFRDEGDRDRAIASFERAIREGGGYQPEAYAGLGLLYLEMAESAGSAYETENERRFQTLGAQRLNEAIVQLHGAPDAIPLYQMLGRALEMQGKPREAIGLYESFLEVFGDTPDATAVRSFIEQLKIALRTGEKP